MVDKTPHEPWEPAGAGHPKDSKEDSTGYGFLSTASHVIAEGRVRSSMGGHLGWSTEGHEIILYASKVAAMCQHAFVKLRVPRVSPVVCCLLG